MKRLLLAVLVILGLTSSIAEENSKPPVRVVATNNPLGNALDRQVHNVVLPYMEEAGRSGMCIAVIRGDSTCIYGYGRISGQNRSVPDGNTLFEIGSVTKTFTSIMLSQLVAEGKMRLDEGMAKYLPASISEVAYDGQKITLQHLATHTSGLPRLPDDFFVGQVDMGNPFKDYDSSRVYHFLSNYQLARKPGTRYEYSNLAVGILGTIFERTTGQNYEQLVLDRICKPLGMNNTRIQLGEEQQKQMAQGHTTGNQTLWGWDFKAMAAGGALRSNANDLVKFMRANMNPAADSLGQAMSDCQKIRFRSKEAIMGLGWHVMYVEGKQVIWHDGRTGGYTTFCGFSKETNTGIVILSSSANHIDKISLGLLKFLNEGHELH